MAVATLALSFKQADDLRSTINSEPSVLAFWGYGDLEDEADVDDLPKKSLWGAVVGCIDGSLYIFRPDLSKPTRKRLTASHTRFSADGDAIHLPPRRGPYLSLSRSRNASPSPSPSNTSIHVIPSSKSRATSGLSKEQIEASKNYVDFEDEQEKMKGMISDRLVRDMKDRSSRSSLSPPYDTSVRRTDDARSLASVESNSTLLSPPLSPTLDPQHMVYARKNLLMRGRIIPQNFGFGHSVVALKVLQEGELILSLQESGKVSLYKTLDGACIVSAGPGEVLAPIKSTLVVAVANADAHTTALDSGEADDQTRVVIFELSGLRKYEFGETTLLKLGDLLLDGSSKSIALYQDLSRSVRLYIVDQNLQLLARTLTILPLSTKAPSGRRQASSALPSLSLPQSFRDLVSRSEQSSPSNDACDEPSRIDVQPPQIAGTLPLPGSIEGVKVQSIGNTLMGVAWSTEELLVFNLRERSLLMRCVIPIRSGLRNIDWLNENTIRLICLKGIETYALPDSTTNDSCESVEGKPSYTTTKLLSCMPISDTEIVCTATRSSQQILSVQINTDCQRIVILQQGSSRGSPRESLTTPVWSALIPTSQKELLSPPWRVTAILPVSLDSIIVGYRSGVSLTAEAETFSVVHLSLARNLRTGQRVVVGGGDDGSIVFWDLTTLKLQARWIIFTEPLKQVVQLEDDATGRLKDCCLCVSVDGTIAVIVVDGFNFLYLIPGSPARLRTLSLSADNLLLFYEDGRTRQWNVKTREFRRSMSVEKATEMLAQGSWFSTPIAIDCVEVPKNGPLSAWNRQSASGDPLPIVLLDIPALVEDFTRGQNTPGGGQRSPAHIKAVLAAMHTPGLDDQIDRVVAELVGTMNSSLVVGSFDVYRNHQTFCFDSPSAVWHVSPDMTAARLSTIVALLRILLNVVGCERLANTIISFYIAALPMLIGPTYYAPSLAVLARYWVAEIRQAARLLFESEVSRLPDEEVIAVVEAWQHRCEYFANLILRTYDCDICFSSSVPSLLPDSEKQSVQASLALSLCGNTAIEKYSLLSSTTLADIARSITIYLFDDISPHRALAIELCARGFEIWQQYFDAMEALRSLFTLATTAGKETISVRNPGPQARMAVLQIASSNSPLFMTTLSLDILHPRSIEYSRSVLQIIAFLIRKKPLVLYPNLPRLMEAVVKSLDPGSNADREAVLDTVTEIIALVVQTFPTVDFHTVSQRLAVGTSEGAVIMYDLKTATRLYVLEGHRKRLAGISFSPDGRRMVTLSIDESLALVWKVGSSFTSFFHPGAPPRQGRSGSDPYKTLNFVLKDEAALTVEAALKQVRFDWPSDRNVRVEIRDAKFTFTDGVSALWPMPSSISTGQEALLLSSGFAIYSELASTPDDLAEAMSRTHACLFNDSLGRLVVGRGSTDVASLRSAKTLQALRMSLADSHGNNSVKSIADEVFASLDTRSAREAYALSVPADGGDASLTANSTLGLLRGLTTFEQLWYTYDNKIYAMEMPLETIDAPAYAYRGFGFDTARNFFPVSDILRTLDAMSWVKVVSFLSINIQSFPLEVCAFPELSEAGAYSAAHVYSEDDVQNIIAYAAARGIDVVLELDTPGHETAIGLSHPEHIACYLSSPWSEFANEPPAGQLRLATPATVNFSVALIEAVSTKFRSSLFSTGGDEVNEKCYAQDVQTQADLESAGLDLDGALDIFLKAEHAVVRAQGKTPIVKEDMILDHNTTLPNTTIAVVWISSDDAKNVTSRGYRIIHQPSNYFYLDCGAGEWIGDDIDGLELCPFQAITSISSLTLVIIYSFDPLANLTAMESTLVLGGQIPIWSEQSSPQNLDPIVWPRAASAAEVFWSGGVSNGAALNVSTALPRLHEMRFRMVRRGVQAIPLQPEWCALRPGTCELDS
ncbi:hypothetical protein EW145_g1735 [Phellinidium pouzarii]|uniref:beta-N-acetylhexosaminidase n=1 Tax=Phellinidium pouzarii TaxID=167371 RepID=A0A4S4LF47_9AGAM|nr:hypothetical protein EW145_g1735 [Phellinidium pouzarii]